MFRLLLTAVFSIAMLVNPVLAATARVDCEQAMSQADAPVKASDQTASDEAMMASSWGEDPCCDHNKTATECAKACAALHIMSAAPPPTSSALVVFIDGDVGPGRPALSPSTFDPNGLERPPKLHG